MALNVGGGGWSSKPNVTPMIDVLLTLLVIFMVITPLTPKGESAAIPQPPPKKERPQNNSRAVVVQILVGPGGEPQLKVNQEQITWDKLQPRLEDIFKTRAEKVMFVKADDSLPWSDVAQVIDMAHGAGVDKVGLITSKVEQESGG